MGRANLGIAYAKMAGKEVFVLFVSAILGAQHTECAPMELVFAQMVIIHWSIYSIQNNFDFYRLQDFIQHVY